MLFERGMLERMTKHTKIELTDEQRAELEGLLHKGHLSARTNTRARILLLSDRSQGQKRTDKEVAEAVMCSQKTVANVRRRFLAGGLQSALHDKERPGRVGKLTGEVEAKLTMLACSQPPEGAVRWTLRLLADKMVELGYVDSISHVSVHERLKKQTAAVESEVLVHWQAVRAVRCQDGRRAGSLSAAIRCALSGRVCG